MMNIFNDSAEILDLKQWQSEIAEKPFNLIQASEYLGVPQSELREYVKKGLLRASGFPESCTFNVLELKEFKKQYISAGNLADECLSLKNDCSMKRENTHEIFA